MASSPDYLVSIVRLDDDFTVRLTTVSDAELDANPQLVRTMSVAPPRGTGEVRLLEVAGTDLQPALLAGADSAPPPAEADGSLVAPPLPQAASTRLNAAAEATTSARVCLRIEDFLFLVSGK